jgi:glutamate dehydrogenase
MAQRGDKQKTALIDRLANKAARKRGGGAAAARFVRQYYAQVPPNDIFATPEDDLLAAALSLWRYGQNRKGSGPKIRIFNPDAKKDGWSSPHTVIELVNDDMPFLVDSVTAELNRRNLTIHLVIHPVVAVRRKAGKLQDLVARAEAGCEHKNESLMHLEINEQTLPETLELLRESIAEVLADVRAAVEDWRAMRVRVADIIAELDSNPPPAPAEEIEETKAFLHWLDARNFTFLGYREHAFKTAGRKTTLHVKPRSRLGVLRRDSAAVFEGMHDGTVLSPEVADFMRRPGLMMNSKSNGRSTVHRAVHLDTVAIKRLDAHGKVIGQHLFVGLFTSSVYHQALGAIPVLRHKVRQVVERSGFSPQGHDGKSLLNILESLPRDDLYETALGILHLQERQRVALFVRHDPFARFVSCLIYVPRERYTTHLRERMQEIIEEGFGGRMSVFYVQVAESALARLQFIIKLTPGVPAPSTFDEIEARLIEAGRDWRDDLGQALVEAHGEARGLDLCRVYDEAFPSSYRERYDAADTVADIARIQALDSGRSIAMDLHQPDSCGPDEVRFKIYHPDEPVTLSDVLPMLENLGFKVVAEVPSRIEPAERDGAVWIHDFSLVTRAGVDVALDQIKRNFEELFVRVWDREAEDDGFNRLVVRAGLSWRQVVTLRAYCKYLRQVGIPFSQAYMEDTLAGNPTIARLVVDLFEVQFDPAMNGDRESRVARLRRDAEATWSAPRCGPTSIRPPRTAGPSPISASRSTAGRSRRCRCRGRWSRYSSIRRASRRSTCAAAGSPAAASAGRTGGRISAPRSSG